MASATAEFKIKPSRTAASESTKETRAECYTRWVETGCGIG